MERGTATPADMLVNQLSHLAHDCMQVHAAQPVGLPHTGVHPTALLQGASDTCSCTQGKH
jgi:hypothetical protein